MKKSDTFTERRQEAEKSKGQRLAKFKANQEENSPRAAERAARKQAQSTAQAEHNTQTAAENKIKQADLRANAIAAEAMRQDEKRATDQVRAAQDEQLRKTSEDLEAQEVLNEASRKAKRDERYANRKAKR